MVVRHQVASKMPKAVVFIRAIARPFSDRRKLFAQSRLRFVREEPTADMRRSART